MIERRTYAGDGLRLHARVQGIPARGTVVLLHGFPDDAGSYDDLGARLAAAGYQAVAPYLRGYTPSDPAPDGNYQVAALAADAVAVANAAAGDGPAWLVGHDWGAIATYAAANLAPARWRGVATMAVPPMRAIVANLRRDPWQLRRSWYMAFFQLRGLADDRAAARDFALIERLWRDWSPGWTAPPERLAAVKDTLAAPGGIAAALDYYRCLFRPPRAQRAAWRQSRHLSLQRVHVSGLLLYGRRDGCIGPKLYGGACRAFAAPCRAVGLDAGHFMNLERPDAVAAELQRLLQETAP